MTLIYEEVVDRIGAIKLSYIHKTLRIVYAYLERCFGQMPVRGG